MAPLAPLMPSWLVVRLASTPPMTTYSPLFMVAPPQHHDALGFVRRRNVSNGEGGRYRLCVTDARPFIMMEISVDPTWKPASLCRSLLSESRPSLRLEPRAMIDPDSRSRHPAIGALASKTALICTECSLWVATPEGLSLIGRRRTAFVAA